MTINVVKPEVLYNEYNPENEEKDVVDPTENVSENVHGGDEVTGSVQDQRFALQPNQPQDTGLGNGKEDPSYHNDDGNMGQRNESLNSDGVMRYTVFRILNDNGSGTGTEKLLILIGDGEGGRYNTFQAFNVDEKRETEERLYLELYKLIEYLSDEEKQLTPQPGLTTTLNVKRLMVRQYERKPVNVYYEYRSRSQIILILDNSGSMEWLINELNTFFMVALKRRDVQIFIAPNGNIENYYDYRTKRFEPIIHETAVEYIKRSGLPVIYISDFDGANLAVELSQSNRVYWVCTETRFKYFKSHSWVDYKEDDFKGFFGRAFDNEEMISVLKEFVKNIHRQRFWYDNHDIEDFREEEYRRDARNRELLIRRIYTERALSYLTISRNLPLI